MAIVFLEAGSDSTGDLKLWSGSAGTVASSTANPHTGPRAVRCDSTASNLAAYLQRAGVLADAGRRISFWVYTSALSASSPHLLNCVDISGSSVIALDWNSAGKLALVGSASTTGTTVLAAATWYRITLCYTITSTSVNEFRLYIGDTTTPEISKTNYALARVGSVDLWIGMVQAFGASKTVDVDDVYLDDSTALTNPGDVRCTHKSYVGTSEGTGTNDYDTAVGAAQSTGSRYLNVSERPASDTNGWQQAATTQTYEKYLIQGAATGDGDISGMTLLGWMAWVRTKTAASANMSITDNDGDTSIANTTTIAQFTHITTSGAYPAGRFGVRSTGTTTDSFVYEGGVVMAYAPSSEPYPAGYAQRLPGLPTTLVRM